MRSTGGVTGEAGGGLSVTGSLSNFSLYIFHPYGGGGQKKTSLAALENTFRKRAGLSLTFAVCLLLRLGRGAVYCDQFVCLSVCVSVCP